LAFEKVRNDKEREVKNGHDGTWVAHPALVSVAKEIFDQYMPSKNQIDKKFEYHITESDLLEIPKVKLPKKESEKISMSEFFILKAG
jgi:malate synthase